ncbi:MAG: metalloendopeptidase [Erythrobacter sp. 34-65-8]|nr:MAG: metalloendopeptidase [Erythrobacter sp. 34-65-8]
MSRPRAFLIIVPILASLAAAGLAQRDAAFVQPAETRAALARAQAQAAEAERRSVRLEREARAATEAAEKTAREAAALAARIQQAEAGIDAAEARLSLIDGQRGQLERRLAERREPLLRLTAALQKLARRPVALSALRPGSLRETVYLSAMLETTMPEVRRRTSALRAEIDRGRRLEREARQALAALRTNEDELADRRQRLAALETRQRLASRQANSASARESERALAMAEEARDLDALVEQLDEAAGLRADLAALPGPVLRPAQPRIAEVGETAPSALSTGAPEGYQLPVSGRTVTGFDSVLGTGLVSKGIAIAPRSGAQVVTPAGGRVAFAGPYRGYGRIVIVEHDGGWVSLVTGLARTDVAVGDMLVGGAPLGVAGAGTPLINLELRRNGKPVNPLDQLR